MSTRFKYTNLVSHEIWPKIDWLQENVAKIPNHSAPFGEEETQQMLDDDNIAWFWTIERQFVIVDERTELDAIISIYIRDEGYALQFKLMGF